MDETYLVLDKYGMARHKCVAELTFVPCHSAMYCYVFLSRGPNIEGEEPEATLLRVTQGLWAMLYEASTGCWSALGRKQAEACSPQCTLGPMTVCICCVAVAFNN